MSAPTLNFEKIFTGLRPYLNKVSRGFTFTLHKIECWVGGHNMKLNLLWEKKQGASLVRFSRYKCTKCGRMGHYIIQTTNEEE